MIFSYFNDFTVINFLSRFNDECSPDLDITGGSWNILCWFGSLFGHPDMVLDACNQATELSHEQNYEHRDSRGFARALTGDIDGAIEDFQFYVDKTTNTKRKAQRQTWIK